VIAALLAKLGLPALVAVVEAALGRIDHPAAAAATEALGAVSAAIEAKRISPEAVAEANRHVETLAKLDTDEARAALGEINATIRAEAAAGDAFTRRWRPTLGYVVALAWGAQMTAASYVVVAHPESAAAVLSALAALFPMWSVALGVLGVAVIKRSDDKRLAAGHAPAPAFAELIGAALDRRAAPPSSTPK